MWDPVEVLKEYVRLPSVSADAAYAGGIRDTVAFLESLLRRSGFAVEVVPTGRNPILLAERGGDPSWPRVLIYGHYDVQPPDPLDKWTTPAFEPSIRNGRLYARGAADNKGPFLAHLAAAAQLFEDKPDLPLRVLFLIEGEEEIGSPSFAPFLREHGARLAADFVFMSDTGSLRPDQVTVTCGLRGIATLEVEVTGPRMDLHSGLHGGVLLNPIEALAGILASLHTADGRVNVPGFHDDVRPVQAWEREELKRLGQSEAAYRKFLGIPAFRTTRGVSPFEAIRFLPTLEFNGIGGGYQGEGPKTVIPAVARAKISCRLVPDQKPARIAKLVEKAIRARAPRGVKVKVTHGHRGDAYVVVPPDRPNTPRTQRPALARGFRALHAGVADVFGKPPLYLREGGSVPIVAALRRELGIDSVLLGLCLPEDNLHAPDESFDLGMFERGSRVVRRVLEATA